MVKNTTKHKHKFSLTHTQYAMTLELYSHNSENTYIHYVQITI